jgi:hypothetical protein
VGSGLFGSRGSTVESRMEFQKCLVTMDAQAALGPDGVHVRVWVKAMLITWTFAGFRHMCRRSLHGCGSWTSPPQGVISQGPPPRTAPPVLPNPTQHHAVAPSRPVIPRKLPHYCGHLVTPTRSQLALLKLHRIIRPLGHPEHHGGLVWGIQHERARRAD